MALITLIRRFEEGVALTTILSRRSWKGGDSDIISITASQNPSFFVGTGGGGWLRPRLSVVFQISLPLCPLVPKPLPPIGFLPEEPEFPTRFAIRVRVIPVIHFVPYKIPLSVGGLLKIC